MLKLMSMFKNNNKIGIWGYKITGKAILNYLLNNNYKNLMVCDLIEFAKLNKKEIFFLNKNNIKYINQNNQIDFIENFLKYNDNIILSPGINLNNLNSIINQYQYKFITELDLFFNIWQKKIIAITGSIGKTSITTFLGQILKFNNINTKIGGNIGNACFNLIKKYRSKNIVALLEISSFQLEYTKNFAPDLAIWTNFYPNHLDRHKSLENYFNAKANIIKYQNKDQIALIPIEIKEKITKIFPKKKYCFFADYSSKELENNFELDHNYNYYILDKDKNILKIAQNNKQILINIKNLLYIKHDINWLILVAACDLLNLNINNLLNIKSFNFPEHRLEFVTNINNIEIYNDSKSTVPESTLSAINNLTNNLKFNNNIHLFLGGISKGINRENLIKNLENKISHVYCFGKEHKELHNLFIKNSIKNIKLFSDDLLENLLKTCIKNLNTNDIILFSPAGASFDQFKDFKARGNYFKKLINKLLLIK